MMISVHALATSAVVQVPLQVTTQSVPGGPTTTFPLVVPTDPGESTIGGIVFFVVVLIIAAGALILYLRNRAPRLAGDAGTPPRSS